jgi:hypothetical protein
LRRRGAGSSFVTEMVLGATSKRTKLLGKYAFVTFG